MSCAVHAPDPSRHGTNFALFFSKLSNQQGDQGMAELRLKREKVDYSGNLHIKNSLRMQELLNAESFRKWKKLRCGGQNPLPSLEPSNQFKNERP
jgi:hypothetical protein